MYVFFFQAEDGIRDLVRSRGLGDVYKRQSESFVAIEEFKNDQGELEVQVGDFVSVAIDAIENGYGCLLYTSDAADERSSVDLGGRRII